MLHKIYRLWPKFAVRVDRHISRGNVEVQRHFICFRDPLRTSLLVSHCFKEMNMHSALSIFLLIGAIFANRLPDGTKGHAYILNRLKQKNTESSPFLPSFSSEKSGVSNNLQSASTDVCWPKSSFSMVQPTSGCPAGFEMGIGTFTMNHNSSVERPDLLKAAVSGRRVTVNYCSHAASTAPTGCADGALSEFPKGSYCLNMYRQNSNRKTSLLCYSLPLPHSLKLNCL